MLRQIAGCTIAIFVLFSCKNKQEPVPEPLVKGVSLKEMPVAAEKILGTYTGDFNGSPISIRFRHVAGKNISGYNIHKGLKRNIAGSIEFEDGKIHIQVSEPGTNPFDGHFELWLDTTTMQGEGKWIPMEKGKGVNFKFRRQVVKDEEWNMYSMYEDSLRNSITLHGDGSCVYKYPIDTITYQLQEIRGNFKMNPDSTINFFWQKNDIFPTGKSSYRLKMHLVDPQNEIWILTLMGEGRELYQFFP